MRCGLGVWVFLGAGWMIVVLWVWVMQVLDSWTNGFFLAVTVACGWVLFGGGGYDKEVGGRLKAGWREGEWMGSIYWSLAGAWLWVVGCGLGVSVAGEMGGVGGWMGIGAPTKG